MTTRNIRTRTPRRRKEWAHSQLIDDLTTATTGVAGDLLANYKNEIGLVQNLGITVMRIVGYIRLMGQGAAAVTPAPFKVHWGIAWVPSTITSAGDGDAQIPSPASFVREVPWIQKGILLAIEPTVSTDEIALEPIETSHLVLDITQMRKQPQRDSELCLMWSTGAGIEAGVVSLEIDVDVMLAV